ncbi:hypothetical protein S3E15_01247 [Bacillus mycoides]|uniref:Uncharacterized protein n=1 Tax=Bacillus mycoides TaxID=1405 RepID=A0AAP7W6T9_BACMY|nr:hypothetical protein bmyco0001_6600 [Bacillus mycoides DSM 2048]KUH42587.1 hypothetical protein M2E15_2683 [Bacillus mycoides]KUH46743.1 hypothetical protein M2E15_6392 [Bacillus mycoides]OSX89169.1 hypothetical protein BTJ44_04853 [Bacillus mycoides]OSX91216.1 hypothetical protein S3E15_01247 [Bacillus mycoides]
MEQIVFFFFLDDERNIFAPLTTSFAYVSFWERGEFILEN